MMSKFSDSISTDSSSLSHFDCEQHLKCSSCFCLLRQVEIMKCCRQSINLCCNCLPKERRECPYCSVSESEHQELTTGFTGENFALVKIVKLNEYHEGDIVLFHPVLERVNDMKVHLNLLHINKPKPFVLLNNDCYQLFGFEKGKVCDLVIAKLTGPIQQLKNSIELARALGESDVMKPIYCVNAEPVPVGFPRWK